MQSFATNDNNDIYLDNKGHLAIANDMQAVLNICEHVAKTIRGEMVLNVTGGLPYFETVWNSNPIIPVWCGLLRERLSKVAGVVNVLSITTSIEGDQLKYQALIETIYGRGTANG